MATNVTFTPNHAPAPACYPADYNALLDKLTTGGGLNGTIPDNAGGGIYVGSTPPSSALTNKVWYKTDGAGRPLGVFMFYNGNWRKVYTGVAINEVRMYAGPYSVFDGSGRGLVGGDVDGWALCNGQNGTLNLEGYFITGGAWSGSQWVARADGPTYKASGGQRGQVYCTNNNLPPLNSKHWYRNVQSGTGVPALVADFNGSNVMNPVVDQNDGTQGHGQPLNFPILFYAMAYMQFIGYA